MIGYIVHETPRYWKITWGNSQSIYIMKPVDVEECNIYHYNQKEPCITQYWPIRFKISSSGEASYTLNLVCLDCHNKILFENST